MPLRLYNSLTKKVEDFRPADPARITFYSCGPTVYDFAHIGNFRSFLAADVLRRWLESPLCEVIGPDGRPHAGPREVRHVMNITDVGHMTADDNADGGGVDRMEEGGRRIAEAKKAGRLPPGAPDSIDPRDPFQVAQFYAGAFLEDARLLGLRVALDAERDPALMPRPTQKIPQMQAMIRDLLSRGFAYLAGSPSAPGTAVYFDVQRFPEYGALSGNTLDRLRAGAGGRVSEANQSGKRHPADFMLWKVDPAHVMKWEFEGVGAGYPGWHIECSAMAREAMGETIDLHSGGEDNIFPHHECEIAQSRCANGAPLFARHWLHVRHLMVEGEKMSKSKGNFYTIRDLLERGFSPAAIRLELIKTHYRSNANFTEQGLIDSERMLGRWRDFSDRGHSGEQDMPEARLMATTFPRDDVAAAMHDDLNVASAMGAVNAWINRTSEPTLGDSAWLKDDFLAELLGVSEAMFRNHVVESEHDDLVHRVESLLQARAAAKASKNFAEADRIRGELTAMGIEIKDSPQGTTWSRKPKL